MRIVWDEPKRLKTLAERGLDFADLTIEFFARSVVAGAKDDRFKGVGILDGKPVTVIFRPLGSEAIAVISMRYASKAERKAYEKATAAPSETH